MDWDVMAAAILVAGAILWLTIAVRTFRDDATNPRLAAIAYLLLAASMFLRGGEMLAEAGLL